MGQTFQPVKSCPLYSVQCSVVQQQRFLPRPNDRSGAWSGFSWSSLYQDREGTDSSLSWADDVCTHFSPFSLFIIQFLCVFFLQVFILNRSGIIDADILSQEYEKETTETVRALFDEVEELFYSPALPTTTLATTQVLHGVSRHCTLR